MDSFIYKAATMRARTQLALTEIEIKRRVNEKIREAALAGEYWCHYEVPSLLRTDVVRELKNALILAGYKVKAYRNDGHLYITIQWAPEDAKTMFCGMEWDEFEETE